MKEKIENVKTTRSFLLKAVNELSEEQLNKIPDGFNNNIIWNLGHMIAAQQGICYLRSGLELRITENIFHEFKPGSKPERHYNQKEINNIRELMISTLDQLESDLNSQLFENYTNIVTRYNVELKNITDAVNFLPFHEGLHSGYIMSLRKLV
ncbi:MAG: DinB family protein [Sphingobacteriia bacterium]|nr:DinB family protein [Sphingobacteriia bacterium]